MRSRLREVKELANQGAAYGAFVRCGEILAEAARLTDAESRELWRRTVFDQCRRLELDAVRGEALGNVSRLLRIVSSPGAYDKYEIVLLLTLRVQLESAQFLFDALGQVGTFVPPHLDDGLRALRLDPQNRTAYDAALQMARKNWGFPVKSEWLV
jgi:hypothetical protein